MAEDQVEDVAARIARLEAQGAELTAAVKLLTRHATARNWDAVAALIASLIGVLAVVVSSYTAHLQRQQLRAQVWPCLQLEFSTENPSFFVLNQGTGPARVTGMRVKLDGKVVPSVAELRALAGFGEDDRVLQSSLSAVVLPAGKDLRYLQPGERDADRAKFKQLLLSDARRLITTLCYCSVLDECWVVDSNAAQPEPIEACPIPAAERYHD